MERRNRTTIPPHCESWGHALAGLLALVSAAALGAVMLASDYSGNVEAVITAMIIAAFIGGVGAWLMPKLLVFILYRRRTTFPMRWRLPLPLPNTRGTAVKTLDGPLSATGPLIKAPVSGRECIGYEVRLLFDAVGDARPPMWILEEEHIIPFEIDGDRIEADGATIQLNEHLAVSDDDTLDDAEITRFLRQRGLFAFEGEYTIFEAIVEPGQRYRVEYFDRPVGAIPRIRESI